MVYYVLEYIDARRQYTPAWQASLNFIGCHASKSAFSCVYLFLQMMIDGACLLDRVLKKACSTVLTMSLAPDVYGEIAALLRNAEGGDFLVKSVADLFVDLHAVAAHGCGTRRTPMG